jgi:hypothetical protein
MFDCLLILGLFSCWESVMIRAVAAVGPLRFSLSSSVLTIVVCGANDILQASFLSFHTRDERKRVNVKSMILR